MTTISIEGLTKDFGTHRVVDDVTFEVASGSITGFLGPNGAGKTTTLRMALGLVTPTAGRALIGGLLYRDLDNPRHTVGALLEATGFHPGRSGRDHLRVLAQASGTPDARIDEVLKLVDLGPAAGDRVRTYSLGMKQRLGLAAALLGDPEVLILDEPANGLDPAGMAWLRGLLRSLAADGRSVLVSSHVLSEVQQIATDVVIIDKGVLRYSGPLRGLPGDSLEDAFLSLTSAQ